jgi:serine/threonine protein kinase
LSRTLSPDRQISATKTQTVPTDRYIIEREIGRGGLAVVYAGRDTVTDQVVALKVLESADPAARRRLLREGRAQARLQHPNLVALHRVVDVDGWPALVLELVDGGSLQDWHTRYPDASFAEVEMVFRKVCAAVSYAHVHGVVHRDLKPANILLTADGEPKVGDFGIAKVLDQHDATEHGAVQGTVGFMSPEQMRDTTRVDARADVWSLGCLLYQMLTNRVPFEGADMIEIHRKATEGAWERPSGVPSRCIDALEAALTPQICGRAPSVAALLSILDGDERPADNATWHGMADDHFRRREVRRDEVSAEAWEHLVATASRMPSLLHPGIPHTLDLTIDDDQIKLLTTQPVGVDLRSHHAGTRLTEEQTRPILRSLADVLVWMHRQVPPVVHGRLQPGTVFYGEHLVSIDGWDQLGTEPREPGFHPEGEPASTAADMYAFGALAVYLLTRSPPRFTEEGRLDWGAVDPPDEELRHLLEELLADDPGSRPPAGVVRTLLEAHDPVSHDTMSLSVSGLRDKLVAPADDSLSPPALPRQSTDETEIGPLRFTHDGGPTDPITIVTGLGILLAAIGTGLAVWVLVTL